MFIFFIMTDAIIICPTLCVSADKTLIKIREFFSDFKRIIVIRNASVPPERERREAVIPFVTRIKSDFRRVIMKPSFFPTVNIVSITTMLATPILTPKGRGAEITESNAEREKVSADIMPKRAIFFVFNISPHYNIGRNFIRNKS